MTGRTTALRAVTALAALVVVACGSDTPHVQQAAASPLTASSVAFKQTGDAQVTINASSVAYRLDDARLLNIKLTAHSAASSVQTIDIRASLYGQDGRLIGDATGAVVNVAPNSDVQVELSGPHPNGTIASATYEVHLVPAPTPTPTS